MGDLLLAQVLANFLAPLSVLAAIENLFLDRLTRHKIANYVFGFEDAQFKDFEKNATIAALKPFLNKKDTISFVRIAVFSPVSLLFSLQCMALILYFSGNSPAVFVNPLDVYFRHYFDTIVMLGVLLFVTAPFDYFSVWVTKRLFLDRWFGNKRFVSLFALDVFVSALPVILIFTTLYALSKGVFGAVWSQTWGLVLVFGLGMMAMSSLSLLFVMFVQVFIVVAGMSIRGLCRAMRLNQPFALTPASERPLSFIGFLAGVLFAGVTIWKAF